MSAAQLTLIISGVMTAQVLIWAGLAFFRHLQRYEALKASAATAPIVPTATAPAPAPGTVPAWEGYREFRVVRKRYEDEGGEICSFYLAPSDGKPLPPFKPGQYLTFRLPVGAGAGEETKTIVRCYSLSERPRPDHYRVTIKRVGASRPDVPPGAGSNHFHERIGEGDTVWAKAPAGHFHLQESGAGPIALIAGGIGITPLFSMVETLLEDGSVREVWLFHSVRNRREQALKTHLEALAAGHPNLHLQVVYSRPEAGDGEGIDDHHRGHVDIRLLRLTLPWRVAEFYICGPRQMMETLVPALEEWGVPPRAIHYEAFGPASISRPRSAAEATAEARAPTITFSRSGKRLPWDPQAGSLLEFAESHGVAVDSGCRAGGCGCCKTVVEAGEVDYSKTPDADMETGECLLCISTPKTDLTLSA